MDYGVRISQTELQEMYQLQCEIEQKTRRLEELRENVKPLLMAKRPIEPGRFGAILVWKNPRHVPWKQWFVELLGQDKANECMRLYSPQPYCIVQVVEHAVPPLWKGRDEDYFSKG